MVIRGYTQIYLQRHIIDNTYKSDYIFKLNTFHMSIKNLNKRIQPLQNTEAVFSLLGNNHL